MKWVECSITIADKVLTQLEVIVRQASGREACGLVYSDYLLALTNRSDNPNGFSSDPSELASALSMHGEPVAIFHTHPSGDLAPSKSDLDQWHYPRSVMLIAGIRDGALQVKSYQMD